MSAGGLSDFLQNLKDLPRNVRDSVIRHGKPTSDRARSQAIFTNFFLHIHATRIHPHSLKINFTWGLGIALLSSFFILTATGILLMVYYSPAVDRAYASIKDIHYVVPTGRYIRNIHRWSAHLMVVLVIFHMARVFYTASYKKPREFNWLVGMMLFVLTLMLSFSGYLLPWDQLAFWAITIGANIAGSPNELTQSMGLSSAFNVGDIQKELILGASVVGQEALTRFYLLHVMVLPLAMAIIVGLHIWRIRKDGGLSRPGGSATPAGKGVGTMSPGGATAIERPNKTFGLMAVVRDRSPYTGQNPDETVPAWPHLLRAEMLVFMITMLICLVWGFYMDAPLKEMANPAIPENPAKAPWYFLGLQELVSYSAFVGGVAVPMVVLVGLALIPYLDREKEESGVWFSGKRGKRVALLSLIVGTFLSVLSVAIPVNYGWLRQWYPDISQLIVIFINPGSLLTLAYMIFSIIVLKVTKSTRMSAIALFTCFLAGFVVLTVVGTFFRGPNWDFFWSHSQWPTH
jgi:quinol-cytochrome oxidoreductase complex cytochrome b subunit